MLTKVIYFDYKQQFSKQKHLVRKLAVSFFSQNSLMSGLIDYAGVSYLSASLCCDIPHHLASGNLCTMLVRK